MSAATRLTKKQKKALAFRTHKTGKAKDRDGIMEIEMEAGSIPIMEHQDLVDAEGGGVEVETVGGKKKKSGKEPGPSAKSKEKAKQGETEQVVGKSKKRKRQTEAESTEEGRQVAKRKKNTRLPDGAETAEKDDEEEQGDQKAPEVKVKQRYILFVGNLRYTTSLEAIKAHFARCDPPPSIRLLTPKPASPAKPVNKSKGCAFLEFAHRNALQQALKLHQSELEGRMINVELTAGGGGKSTSRIAKLKERNKGLFGQRKERTEKQGLSEGSTSFMPDRPQRYSATSGIDQAPAKKRTWTVGSVADDGETHRGGKMHAKDSQSRRPRRNAWGTGVNAIPVG